MSKKQRFCIEGTHCAACEVLLERRLKKIPGVTKASVNHKTGETVIEAQHPISNKAIQQAVNKDGYKLQDETKAIDAPIKPRDYLEIATLVLVFVAIYFVLKYFDIAPNIGVSNGMSLGVVFVIGLIAATSTCLAVTGGLLLALATKYSEMNPGLSGVKKFKPTLYFNAGRIVGYTAFGAALGALGSLFTFSLTVSGFITVLAALIMIVLGLQMLRIFAFLNKLSIRMPKFLAHSIYSQSDKTYKPWAPFVLGAGTFFVPCGFTQALQFYVLAQGSVYTGATTMLVFALGTLPMLLTIGAVSSFTRGSVHKHFVRAAAVLVILLGLLSIPAGLALIGIPF